MNILITGVGGPTPRSFANSLKKFSNYTDFRLIGTDSEPLSMGLYQYHLFDESYVIPRADESGYWNAVREIVKKEKIDIAIVLSELEVLAWSKKQMTETLPCMSFLPDYALAKVLVDKAKMTELLKPLKLVPPSVEFSAEDDMQHLFETLGNEFWVRSSSGSSGLGSLKVDSEKSLQNWISINPEVPDFLASRFLPGRNLACKMLYYKGELLRSACAERVEYVMAKVAPSGVTGNTSFGRLINEPEITERVTKAMDFLFDYTNASKHGFFTADLKEDESGTPFITEVNVRHVAFTQCFAACGANFSEDTIRLLDIDPTFDKTFKYYKFEKDLVFLRDVDSPPIVLQESDLEEKIQ